MNDTLHAEIRARLARWPDDPATRRVLALLDAREAAQRRPIVVDVSYPRSVTIIDREGRVREVEPPGLALWSAALILFEQGPRAGRSLCARDLAPTRKAPSSSLREGLARVSAWLETVAQCAELAQQLRPPVLRIRDDERGSLTFAPTVGIVVRLE